MYSWTLIVHGYLQYHSNHLSKLKCELNLPQTLPPTHARTRMDTLAFLQSGGVEIDQKCYYCTE
jgi:hypothetical protein